MSNKEKLPLGTQLRRALCRHTRHGNIKWGPERLECPKCGKIKTVHQNKSRNIGNGYTNTGWAHPEKYL